MAEVAGTRRSAPERPASVLPAGTAFSGLLLLPGPARIDGRVDGEVLASDLLWIGETSSVNARVEAEQVVVAGELEGEVRARGRIELLATARVRAAVETPHLVVVEGCVVEGTCRAGAASGLPDPEPDGALGSA